jgi:hypothetical protein
MASNSSIIVSDQTRKLYAYGYQHNTGNLTFNDLVESALSVNKDWDGTAKALSPVEFLAEWHKLALQKWENPTELTVEAIEDLSEMARSDDFHFEIEMDRGYIDSMTCYSQGVQQYEVLFS